MEQIEQLIEDYQRRLKEVTKMIEAAMLRGENFVRLNTKASCYRTFIAELERAKASLNVA